MAKKKNDYGWSLDSKDILAHYGVPGMKWGVRRYQNYDGTLTEAGKRQYRYKTLSVDSEETKAAYADLKKSAKEYSDYQKQYYNENKDKWVKDFTKICRENGLNKLESDDASEWIDDELFYSKDKKLNTLSSKMYKALGKFDDSVGKESKTNIFDMNKKTSNGKTMSEMWEEAFESDRKDTSEVVKYVTDNVNKNLNSGSTAKLGKRHGFGFERLYQPEANLATDKNFDPDRRISSDNSDDSKTVDAGYNAIDQWFNLDRRL